MIDLLPIVKNLVSDKMIQSLKKKGTKTAAKKIYTFLPLPVRLVVTEDSFTKFWLEHQDKIFGLSKPTKSVVKKSPSVKKPAKKVTKKK